MKKLIITTLSLFLFMSVFAHAPGSVKLSYNKADKTLTVEVIHKVSNTESHYIDIITIWVNDNEIETFKPTKQTSKEKHLLTYNIGDLKSGDVVKVMANCNKMGKKSATITIK